MTREEWITAYVLRFGTEQAYTNTFADGEGEFLEQMQVDLGISHFNALVSLQDGIRRAYGGSNDR